MYAPHCNRSRVDFVIGTGGVLAFVIFVVLSLLSTAERVFWNALEAAGDDADEEEEEEEEEDAHAKNRERSR